MGERLPASDWGFIVHPVEAWPIRSVSYGGEYRTLEARPILHTVQTCLSFDTLAVKRARRAAGMDEQTAASVVILDGAVWVFDGHHFAAAAWAANDPLRVFVHTAPGSEPINPPRLA